MSEMIENILCLLEDGRTYCQDTICLHINIPHQQLEKIIKFLKQFNLVETDEKMENIKLTKEFLDFLVKVKS